MRFILIATLSIPLFLSNLKAIELSQICGDGTSRCNIDATYDTITNNGTFIFNVPLGSGNDNSIILDTNGVIDTFINYGILSNATNYDHSFFWAGGYVRNIINYGIMGGIGGNRVGVGANIPMSVTNYGRMKSIGTSLGSGNITIDNYGVIDADGGAHHLNANNVFTISLKNYAMIISQDSTTFNTFTGNASDNSHLVFRRYNPNYNDSLRFQDENSKVILDFGNTFELGNEYSLDKLIIYYNENGLTALNVDFSRLTTRSELYTLTQSGNNFIVNLANSKTAGYSLVGSLHKSNIKTMNNLYLQSNNMIYPHKYKRKKFGSVNPNTNPRNNNYRRVRGISNLFMNAESLGESYAYNSANLLESNQYFFYDNEWLLARDNANARKVNMDYTHSVKAVNNSNVSKDAYYNKGAYRNKIITNDTRTNEINQYQSTNRVGNVSRTPNQNNRHLANQSNNSPCGSYKCIYIYKPQQTQTKQIQPQKVESKPQPKIEPKVVEQPKIEPKIQPQPKPIQAIRPTMPPPPKVEPKIEPKPIVQPKEQPKPLPKVEQPKAEPKVVKVESKPTPPKPKVIIQDPYYFILTPYIAHNFFYEAGRYNLSGLEYGFITAFSGKITEEHILGLHFAFSYGSLKDSVDSIFNIASMNIMGGLNYKFDMTNDMYLKARVDIFYFLNQVQSTMTSGNIMKPNNLGFGASVAYGKEWDFDKNGILGLEVALDYKGLMSPTILTQNGGDSTINESFNKALYNMLYVDLGLNYDKYFETNIGKWGLDTGLGVKVNATANALAKSTIRLNNIRDINMTLDNDMFLAYLNIGGSYLLESKDFDMEFSLAYYGNFGDRSMSNAGGFEWRVYW